MEWNLYLNRVAHSAQSWSPQGTLYYIQIIMLKSIEISIYIQSNLQKGINYIIYIKEKKVKQKGEIYILLQKTNLCCVIYDNRYTQTICMPSWEQESYWLYYCCCCCCCCSVYYYYCNKLLIIRLMWIKTNLNYTPSQILGLQ